MSFIEIASILHSNKYNYDKVIYVNNNIGVIINCPIHGDFIQLPKVHLRPNGCSKCSGKSKKTNEEFVLEASVVFNNRYNYDKSIYLNNTTDVIITCDIHGDFLKSPKLHLRGVGCNKCSNTFRYDRNSYIGKCIEVQSN